MTEQAEELLREASAADRKAQGWLRRRDEAIRNAHRLGASYREIADVCSLSHMTIKRIVERIEES